MRKTEKQYEKITPRPRIMRQKLRFFWLIICLAVCASHSVSCSEMRSDPLEILKNGFTARVSVTGYGRDSEAILRVFPEGEGGVKDFVLEFVAPESLSGLRLERRGELLSVGMGETVFTETEFGSFASVGILSVVDALVNDCAVQSVKSVPGDEYGMPDAGRLTAVTTSKATIYIDPESSAPIRLIPNGGGSLTFNSFTANE